MNRGILDKVHTMLHIETNREWGMRYQMRGTRNVKERTPKTEDVNQ